MPTVKLCILASVLLLNMPAASCSADDDGFGHTEFSCDALAHAMPRPVCPPKGTVTLGSCLAIARCLTNGASSLTVNSLRA